MTLKEKLFNAIFDNAWEFKTENVIPQCELIADEFAIEFAEWVECSKIYYTPVKELIEMFKKEKGL